MKSVPEAVWSLGTVLGEGPAWFAAENALRFVDIKAGRVHRFVPATGERETLEIGGNPGFILPASDGAALIGANHDLHLLDGGKIGETLASVPMPAHNRINDATLAPNGELWFGTMDDTETRATGSVFSLVGGAVQPTAFQAVVTNGPAFSPDGETLYVVDSGARCIWRFCPAEDPKLERGQLFVTLGAHEGYPDGVTTDADGCLWVALWDGWGIRRYSPQGELMLHIPLPCARVTKVAFGGDDLGSVFITTARVGLSPAALADQPEAGSLFRLEVPAKGWLPVPWQ